MIVIIYQTAPALLTNSDQLAVINLIAGNDQAKVDSAAKDRCQFIINDIRQKITGKQFCHYSVRDNSSPLWKHR